MALTPFCMNTNFRFIFGFLAFGFLLTSCRQGERSQPKLPLDDKTSTSPYVEIIGAAGHWTLLRNGKPYFVHGVCGDGDYDLLVRSGGNTIRTYSANDTEQVERARQAGLAVVFGVWLGHERHGFSYVDPEAIAQQRKMVVDAVTAHRDDPTILMWALGNEMEGNGGNPAIWLEINHLARLVKTLDSRPVLTVIAGAAPIKLEALRDHCPDLDLIGINSYGGLSAVHERMLKHGPEKPYLITEYGAYGPWESPKTSWGAEFEQTSTEKADVLLAGTAQHIARHAGRCLGGFAFRWGHKQEATHTWFGLFLDDGSPTAGIDALQRAWTGVWPVPRAPAIEPLEIPSLRSAIKVGDRISVSAAATSPTYLKLSYQWSVYEESRDRKHGGDKEQRPAAILDSVLSADRAEAELVALSPGRYRLFVTVKDPDGRAATANVPFLVE